MKPVQAFKPVKVDAHNDIAGVCVCVLEKERENERERKREKERERKNWSNPICCTYETSPSI